MSNSKFNKLKDQNTQKAKGALDIVDSSVEEKYVADMNPKNNEEVKIQVQNNDEDEKVLRSYSLTKKQLKMLQIQKIEEVDLTLSDIVGKAIESYCSK